MHILQFYLFMYRFPISLSHRVCANAAYFPITFALWVYSYTMDGVDVTPGLGDLLRNRCWRPIDIQGLEVCADFLIAEGVGVVPRFYRARYAPCPVFRKACAICGHGPMRRGSRYVRLFGESARAYDVVIERCGRKFGAP